MKPIPFTRFHLPNGRQTTETIEVNETDYAQYEKIRDAGFRMTVEILTNGLISMAIEDRELGDFDCVICPNGPEVPVRLSEMLGRFDEGKIVQWREEISA